MTTKKFCDKCNKEIAMNECFICNCKISKGSSVTLTSTKDSITTCSAEFDLCPDCYYSLCKYLEQQK